MYMMDVWLDFFVCLYAKVSLYVDFYKDVDAFEEHEVGTCVICLDTGMKDQSKMILLNIIELYVIIWYEWRNAQFFLM